MFTSGQLRLRKRRILALLLRLDEVYESGRPETGMAKSGFAEPVVRRYVCGSCAGNGCPRCQAGRVAVLERDPYMTSVIPPAASSGPRTMSSADIDRALERLREDKAKRDGLIDDVPWSSSLRASELRDARSSYRMLRVALGVMPGGLSGDNALEWLARNIPGQILLPREDFIEECEQLADEADFLDSLNLDHREIAEYLGVSRRRVRKLLERPQTG